MVWRLSLPLAQLSRAPLIPAQGSELLSAPSASATRVRSCWGLAAAPGCSAGCPCGTGVWLSSPRLLRTRCQRHSCVCEMHDSQAGLACAGLLKHLVSIQTRNKPNPEISNPFKHKAYSAPLTLVL